MTPQAAQAFPRAANCAGCHIASTSTTTTAVPSTSTPAAGATYTVAITLAANPFGGNTGYEIVAVAPTPAPNPAVFSGDNSTQLAFSGTMVVPAAAGTYRYTVYTNQGSQANDQVGSKDFSITVGAVVTTPPTSTTTTTSSTTPPTSTTTTTSTTPPVTTAPGAPTEVTAVAGDGEALVFWTVPANAPADTLYTVTASPGGATVTTSEDLAIVSGLTNGTAYTFTVVATNEFGTSPASAASAAVIPAVEPIPTTTTPTTTTTTSAVSANSGVAPVGAPDTGAGGASNLR